MSKTDAAILLGGLTTIIIPWIHSWLKANIIPDWIKFAIAVIISALGGYLTVLVSGQFINSESIIQNAALICAAGATIYGVFFKALGLEKVIQPRAALLSEVQKSAAGQVNMFSHETVKDAMDPESNTVIRVSAEPVIYTGADTSPVRPKG